MSPEETQVPAPGPSPEVREYLATWAESLTQVLTQIAGSPCGFAASFDSPQSESGLSANDLQVAIVAAGGIRGEMSLRMPGMVVVGLAQLFLGEPQDAAVEVTGDHKEAVEELLRQVAGHVATGLKPRWGEVQLRVETGNPPTWSAAASGWLRAATAPCLAELEWQLSAAIYAALAAVPPPSPAADETLKPPPARADSADSAATGEPSRLGLLLDVELDVILRFGARDLRLREVLELSAGSVVELDRQVEEPADLLLGGRLIARGEVVVVDGHYGLRVLEVAETAAELQH